MKNILYLLLTTFVVSMQVHASEYDLFIGGEAGLSWADFNGPNGEYQNPEITTYGLKGGLSNDSARMYLSYKYIDAFEDSSTRKGQYQTLTANTDAFTDYVSIFNLFDLAFFIGAHAGVINLTVEADFGETDEYAFLYGLQTGLIADFNSPLTLEVGYRYSYSNFSEQGTDLDRLQVAYGGINFRF
ncbi:MAG: hypothetical protein COA44_04095 [Arcobacter sp.]|nr:MAG: hypothetical protein COA44_04095 [Arcobacter sp.]